MTDTSIPFLAFDHETVQNDGVVEQYGGRIYFNSHFGGLLLEVGNETADDAEHICWFMFTPEEIKTLRAFLNRHHG